MKQRHYLYVLQFALLALFSNSVNAQSMWTWIKGPNATIDENVAGVLGSSNSTTTPGGRDGAISWQDANGNLWYFGGSSALGYYNDLWKYTPSTNQWTWMKGDTIADMNSVYGPLGVATNSANPGSRGYACGWADNNGNLWLFGGDGFDASNSGFMGDLWKYTISSNQWTWMGGSNTIYSAGVYGTLGVAGAGNAPGARVGPVSWTDNTGNLWLFGGVGLVGGFNFGSFNDLWKYSPSTGLWTWMKGSNSINASGVYGTLNTPAANNTPGARALCQVWKATSTDLYLFGGTEPVNGDSYNDLWKYNLSSGNWTWIGGSNTINQSGSYGTLGVPSTTNIPGARIGGNTWVDNSGLFWLFGGQAYDVNNNLDAINDQWSYNPANGQWTWVKGSNQIAASGLYGVMGTPSTTNIPGARGTSGVWYTSSGQLYLYGGQGYESTANYGELSDMWRYGVCAAPANPTVVSQPTTVCSNQNFTLTANAGNNTVNWYAAPTSTIPVGSGTNFVTFVPNIPTTVIVTYYAEAFSCAPSATRIGVTMTIVPGPTITVANGSVCAGQSFTLAPSGASNYTYSSGSSVVQPTSTTIYTINGTSGNCVGSAQATVVALPAPTVNITSSNTLLCIGENNTVTLQAAGASTYSWSTTSTSSSIVVTPTVSSSYTVTGNDNGCEGTAVISLSVICAGLSPNDLSTQINLYPNPASTTLQFNTKDVELTTATLYSSNGAVIGTYSLADQKSIAINELPVGLYLVTVKSINGETAHLRFIKE